MFKCVEMQLRCPNATVTLNKTNSFKTLQKYCCNNLNTLFLKKNPPEIDIENCV